MSIVFDRFLGANNRLPDYALRTKEGAFVSSAVNVDFLNGGKIKRRAGRTLVQAMTGGHSFWTNGTYSFIVRASTLYAVTFAPYAEALVKVLTVNTAVAYAELNGVVYYSNGTDSGRITSGTTYVPWGLDTPSAPSCASIAGTLDAGKYQVAVSYYNNVTYEESGLSASTSVTLAAAGGVRVTLPSALTGATHIRVYISKLNGAIVGLASTVATGTATVDIAATPTTTLTGDSTQYAPLPPCTKLFEHMGRLCGVMGDTVYVGAPYKHGYYEPLSGYIPFSATVTVAVSNQLGVYIVADKTYWIPGDITNVEGVIRDVLPYGAVAGSEFRMLHTPVVGWMGEKGFVIGSISGEVTVPAEAAMLLSLSGTAPSYASEVGGERHVVCDGWSMNVDTGAMSSYTNFAPTSISGGYATFADGLYTLTGDKDNLTDVTSPVCLGRQELGTDMLKRLPYVYISGTNDTALQLRVETPNTDVYEYLARSYDDELMVQRVDIGRGLRATWFKLTVLNVDGADFELSAVRCETADSVRRI